MGSRFDKAEDSPGFLLWQVTNSWQKEIRLALEPLELTQPQFVLLYSCKWLNERSGTPGITQVQLAQHAKIDVNVTSQVLRTLEKKGYVKRGPHPTDTRANVITVTESGAVLADRAVQEVEKADRAFFSGVGDEIPKLNELLGRLYERE